MTKLRLIGILLLLVALGTSILVEVAIPIWTTPRQVDSMTFTWMTIDPRMRFMAHGASALAGITGIVFLAISWRGNSPRNGG